MPTGTLLAMPRRLLACFVALASAARDRRCSRRDQRDRGASSRAPPRLGTARRGGRCGDKLQCATLTRARRLLAARRRAGRHRGRAPPRHRARAGASARSCSTSAVPATPGARRCRASPARSPHAVRARYDLVSFDPRGTGQLAAGRMRRRRHRRPPQRGRPHAELRRRAPAFYDGTNEPVDVVARCVARNGAWLAQLGSRNVARDRRSPARRARRRHALVRRLLVRHRDRRGVRADVPRSRRAHGARLPRRPLGRRARGAARRTREGFEQALDDFLADCAADSDVPVPQRRRSHRRARHASSSASRAGLELPTVDLATGGKSKRKAGVAAFYTALISALYDRQYGWPELADALNDARAGDGSSCSRSPTSTTAAATTAATTTSTRSSA